MRIVKFITAVYEESESLEKQGTRQSVQKYLKQGFKIQSEHNGFFVLTKPVRVRVVVSDDGKQFIRDMKGEILKYYDKLRMSQKLFETFMQDAQSNNIKFYFNRNDQLSIE